MFSGLQSVAQRSAADKQRLDTVVVKTWPVHFKSWSHVNLIPCVSPLPKAGGASNLAKQHIVTV